MSASPSSIIRAELRWLTAVAALADRPDRTEAFLQRHTELPGRLDTIQGAYAKLLDLLDTKGDVEKLASYTADVNQCEELGFTIEQRAQVLLKGQSSSAIDASPVRSRPDLAARLPAIQLPVFSGALEEWTSFIDLFTSLIASREDLTPALKLAQLMSVLAGEPRQMLSHLSITDDNFEPALDLLHSRYNNVRRLAESLINKVWAIPKVSRTNDIRLLILNPVLTATRALKKMGMPVDQWSFPLLTYLLPRLPLEVQSRFELQHGGNSAQHIPNFTVLIDFLEVECRRADTPDVAPTAHRPPTTPRNMGGASQRPVREAGAAYHQKRFNVVAAGSTRCLYCKDPAHSIANCNRFLAHRVPARRDLTKQRNWCFICLGHHFARDCTHPRPCGNCDGKHHPVLCMNRSGEYGTPPPQDRRTDVGPPSRKPVQRFAGSRTPSPRGGGFRTGGPSGAPRGVDANYAAAVRARSPRQESSLEGNPPGAPRGSESGTIAPWPHGASGATGGCFDRVLPAPEARFSPPLAERPRLERRNPTYGRSIGHYQTPLVAYAHRWAYDPGYHPLMYHRKAEISPPQHSPR